MNIAIVGTGYVGLVTGACLADFGHDVICVDIDRGRIGQLESGVIPFFEPQLLEVVERNRKRGRLRFSTDFQSAVQQSLVVFLAVGTPEGPDGAADLSQVIGASQAIAQEIAGYRVVVTKSTVPISTAGRVRSAIASSAPKGATFDVVSNPEFLREGSAVGDFMRPDRVVIGADTPAAAALVKEIYRPLYLIETPIIVTDIATAELIKYAANSFLAVKISYINEVANLCDAVGPTSTSWQRLWAWISESVRSFCTPARAMGDRAFRRIPRRSSRPITLPAFRFGWSKRQSRRMSLSVDRSCRSSKGPYTAS